MRHGWTSFRSRPLWKFVHLAALGCNATTEMWATVSRLFACKTHVRISCKACLQQLSRITVFIGGPYGAPRLNRTPCESFRLPTSPSIAFSVVGSWCRRALVANATMLRLGLRISMVTKTAVLFNVDDTSTKTSTVAWQNR